MFLYEIKYQLVNMIVNINENQKKVKILNDNLRNITIKALSQVKRPLTNLPLPSLNNEVSLKSPKFIEPRSIYKHQSLKKI